MGAGFISVIVPAYNAATTIDRCLDAVAQQTAPREGYEILVVDDGSADETCIRVTQHRGVSLLTQDHAGPAAARNRGVERARGEIVLFTDADCAPAPDWIEHMVAPFGMSQAPQPAAQPPVAGVKGAYLTRQRALVARFVQIEYEERYDRMAREEAIDFVDTYSAGYGREILIQNGGFDTSFPVASVEDQELSFRLARRGYRLVFVPQARVYHWGHPHTVAAYWRRKFKIGYWKVAVVRRHPGKLWRDSHTPPSLKVQMLLAALGGLCLLGGLFWSPVLWGIALSGVGFLLTALPFARRAWRRDPAVAAVAPTLLLVRALALGAGFVVGLLSSARSRSGPSP
jgi:glycosyltransferase involved in cell wall biosynthesis